MNDIAKIVKRQINEKSNVVRQGDGKPWGWGLFMGINNAAKERQEQRIHNNDKRGLYVQVGNPDARFAANAVINNSGIERYSRIFYGDFREDFDTNIKKNTEYIIISDVEGVMKDADFLNLVMNVIDGKVKDKTYNLTVVLISETPLNSLPKPVQDRFVKYKLQY